MSMKAFSPETSAQLKYYVYALVDPRRPAKDTRHIFYVGKGKGQRCFQHAKGKIKPVADRPDPKLDRIAKIHDATEADPLIRIIAHGLSNDEALELESILIGLLRTDGNKVSGHHGDRYNLTAEEAEGRYANPMSEKDLGHRVLLVNLNGNPMVGAPAYPGIVPKDMKRRTLGKWNIGESNARRVEYVAGVYRQLIMTVYKVEQRANGRGAYYQTAMENGKRRVVFRGERDFAKEELWGNRRVLRGGEVLTKFIRTPWKRVGQW